MVDAGAAAGREAGLAETEAVREAEVEEVGLPAFLPVVDLPFAMVVEGVVVGSAADAGEGGGTRLCDVT